MSGRERIGTAQYSDNLGEVGPEDVGDVDIIRACGMAAQSNPLGLSIWRWRVGGDQRAMFEVAKGLVARGHEPRLVYEVLTHMADDVCRPCHGRGYEVVEGTPMLSDRMCVHCRGTGRKPLEGEAHQGLVEVIAGLQREIAAGIMRRLSRQLDL